VPLLDRLARRLLALLLISFVVYLAGEIVISYRDPVNPLRLYHMPFIIDMHAGNSVILLVNPVAICIIDSVVPKQGCRRRSFGGRRC